MTKSPKTAEKQLALADIWLSAITYWYLTGILAALGFSLGFHLLKPGTGEQAQRDELDAFKWMDGEWYVQIAADGYKYDPEKNTNLAFYPVYPLLGRAVMAITGFRAEAALLVVSNLSFLAALAMLAIYIRSRYPNAPAELTDWAVLAATLFPTGCFFRLAYSESTFLFLSILAMFAMHRDWSLWIIAFVVGLATAARPVGLALLAPFAIHIFYWLRTIERVELRYRRFRIYLLSFSVLLPIACWGTLAFFVYQSYAFGEPFATVRVQLNWGIDAVAWRNKVVPLLTMEPLQEVYDNASSAYWRLRDPHGIPWFSLQFANPLYFVAAIGLVSLGAWKRQDGRFSSGRNGGAVKSGPGEQIREKNHRWLSVEEAAFATFMIMIPYVARAYEMGMGSMGRFVATAFPVYLVLGHLLSRLPHPLRAALLTISGFFLATYTALYGSRHVVF